MAPWRLLALCAAVVRASNYDPHLPAGSPWFEGWYTRISGTSSGHSIGAIVGYYPDASGLTDPAAYVALIIDDGKGETKTYEAYPKGIEVLSKGAKVTSNPHDEGLPDFSVIDASSNTVELRQTGNEQTLKMTFPEQNISFEASLAEPESWEQPGDSPEGWAGKLPFLGLHWFVFSLHSKASFKLTTSVGIISDSGRAHQEKNWGTAFPTSWIWAEAVGEGSTRLALAGGPAPIGPIIVPDAYLLGYRSEKLNWNFHPQDPSIFFPKIDACAGTYELTAASGLRMLKISMKMDPSALGGQFVVGGPTRTGFRSDSVETYRTHVTVEAFSGIFHETLEEKVVFVAGALEFGGDIRCGPKGRKDLENATILLT